MLTFVTHTFLFFQKKETWFYEGGFIREGIYHSYCYAKEPFQLSFDKKLEEVTSLLDLEKKESELFSGIHRSFRYQIKKEDKKGYEYQCIDGPTEQECHEFIGNCNAFFAKKKIAPCSGRRIQALRRMKRLKITRVLYAGHVLYAHAYLFDDERIVLLHSFPYDAADLFVNKNANKLLHWWDILAFKKRGLKIYDFGGINSAGLPGITRFKLSFGGNTQPVNSYTRMHSFARFFYKIYRLAR